MDRQDIDYYPYGGVEHDYCATVAQHYLFTGKERDTESGLDNFGARYHASNLGRFMTPDWAVKPVTVPYAKFGDPQSLNLYTYVENGPLNRFDADGHTDPPAQESAEICQTDPNCAARQSNNTTTAQTTSRTGVENRLGTIAVTKSTTTVVKDKDGNILKWSTTTVTAQFATGSNAGQYLGTTTETTSGVTMMGADAGMSISTPDASNSETHDLKAAIQTFGGGNIMRAQREAASLATPNETPEWTARDYGHGAAVVGLGALGVGCFIGEPCGIIAGVGAAAGVVEGVAALKESIDETKQ